jgi:hypothetical protein
MARMHSESVQISIFDDPSEEIISLYKQHIPVYMSDLLSAVEDENQEQITYRSHKMCSAMKTVGYKKASTLLEKIERDQPKGAVLTGLVGEVEKLVNDSLVILERR